MIKKIFLLTILSFFYLSNFADTIPTVIRGFDKEYAGQIVKVYKTIDYISSTKQILAVDTVSNQGELKLEFLLNETLLINLPLGIYNAILFVEPGKQYEVALPPLQQKTNAEIFNPFFQPIEVYLGLKEHDTLDLNYKIADFNDSYHAYIDADYASLFKRANKAYVDSVIAFIESKYETDSNLFFYNYRYYKYAWLTFLSYMRDNRYVVREFFHKRPFLYQNPAYMDLFNQLFTDYFTFYANSSEGERLYSDIAYAKSPTYIKETFSNNLVLINDTLQELVLLKGLHDAFYQNDYPISSLIITLDSVALSTKIPYHKTVAENIKKKVLQARRGFPAPQFEMRDANGVFRASNDYLANYVYLNFISVKSFTCQQDLELIKKIYEKHKADIKIISICIDDDFSAAIKYFQDRGYDWVLLSYRTQKSIIDEYKVRVYPTYYLINPDGILSMAPAPSPGENFEWHFFKLLQSKKRSQNH